MQSFKQKVLDRRTGTMVEKDHVWVEKAPVREKFEESRETREVSKIKKTMNPTVQQLQEATLKVNAFVNHNMAESEFLRTCAVTAVSEDSVFFHSGTNSESTLDTKNRKKKERANQAPKLVDIISVRTKYFGFQFPFMFLFHVFVSHHHQSQESWCSFSLTLCLVLASKAYR